MHISAEHAFRVIFSAFAILQFLMPCIAQNELQYIALERNDVFHSIAKIAL